MKNIKVMTIVRTIVLLIALANQVLTLIGANPLPFSEEEIYQIISTLGTALASLWAWWENNSFTKAAIMADEEYDRIKAEEKADGESGK